MRRIKINLGDDHRRFLMEEAHRHGVNRIEVVRRLIAGRMAGCRDEDDPFEALAGCAEGDGSSVGVDHDRYLYGDPAIEAGHRPRCRSPA